MTIKQILQKQEKKPDYIIINYIDKNGILWHAKISSADIAKEAFQPIFNYPIQTFDEMIKEGKSYGVFSIHNQNLSKEMIETENYTCPARKTDLDSNNITVRDYLSVRKNIKKVFFTQIYPCSSYKLSWDTNYFDVQELSGSLSFMADLLVDKVKVSDKDESVLQILLLTRNLEKWREQEKEKQKEWQKKQKRRRLKDKILAYCAYFALFGFGGMIGGVIGGFNPLFGAIAGIIIGVIIGVIFGK